MIIIINIIVFILFSIIIHLSFILNLVNLAPSLILDLVPPLILIRILDLLTIILIPYFRMHNHQYHVHYLNPDHLMIILTL